MTAPATLDRSTAKQDRPRYPVDADGLLVTPQQPPDGQPAWALAFDGTDPLDWPRQGEWTVEDYLRLDGQKRAKGIELVDGRLRWRAMAEEQRNDIVRFFDRVLFGLIQETGRGRVSFSDLGLHTFGKTIRKPDVVVILRTNPHYSVRGQATWETADLVIEVVSESDPDNDYDVKRREYAAAGVREYWVVDRYRREILLLTLDNGDYREVGTYRPGDTASSLIVEGLEVAVADALAAGEA